MATFKSDTYLAQSPANGQDWKRVSDGAKVTGNLLIATATVTLAGTEAANDVMNLVLIPEGCTVIPSLCKISAENPGTSLTLQVGDDGGEAGTSTADPDRYSGTVDVSAGGNFDLDGGVTDTAPFKTDSPTIVQAKVIAASSVTADQVVTFTVAYQALS